jgi:hypothetical protein
MGDERGGLQEWPVTVFAVLGGLEVEWIDSCQRCRDPALKRLHAVSAEVGAGMLWMLGSG